MKFALIGKNISHSLSPEIYKKIIKPVIEYDLIDIDCESNLPLLSNLAANYKGINITSPFKKSYLNKEIEIPSMFQKIGINCISFQKNKTIGINTDYLALNNLISKYIRGPVALLGNGVMANCIELILKKYKIEFRVFSRKEDGPLEEFTIPDNYREVINCCSRGFLFGPKELKVNLFWDINYKNKIQYNKIKNLNINYLDGEELLLRQAWYCREFWSGNLNNCNYK